MPDPIRVSEVKFRSASPPDQETGLLGWASATYGGLRLDAIAVRRTCDRKITLSFPSRRDNQGRRHFLVKPLNDASRRDFEHQILSALRIDQEPPQ